MKVAIIGAGASGLVSAKYSLEYGFECDVLEQSGVLGGTWVYTDAVGVDENGIPIHSSMYKDLWCNIAKEAMEFVDYKYPDMDRSFLQSFEVVEYFTGYVEKFGLEKHIQYYKQVLNVTPTADNRWLLTVKDVKLKLETETIYEAVMVCTGHFSSPRTLEYRCLNKFQGQQMHSHDYRTPDSFTGKTVLVIGAGPSGKDISVLMADFASKIYLCHKRELNRELPENIVEKHSIVEFGDNWVAFDDGSKEEIDAILHCTGYNYSFPFLSPECEIEVDNFWIKHLYKHIINVKHPTMGLIGMVYSGLSMPMFDLQARFFLKSLIPTFSLPSEDEMMKELEEREQRFQNKGPKGHRHWLDDGHDSIEYFADLAKVANLKPLPNVLSYLFDRAKMGRKSVFEFYKIIDDEHYIQIV